MFKFCSKYTFNLLTSKLIFLVDEWIKPSKQQHVSDNEKLFALKNLTSSKNKNIPRGVWGGWCICKFQPLPCKDRVSDFENRILGYLAIERSHQ